MKRLPLVLAGFLAIAALPLAAANVTGKVAFVTKRGQNPIPAETLVWVEPASGRALHVNPGTFQIVTRNKILVPHVLAVPVGSTRSEERRVGKEGRSRGAADDQIKNGR